MLLSDTQILNKLINELESDGFVYSEEDRYFEKKGIDFDIVEQIGREYNGKSYLYFVGQSPITPRKFIELSLSYERTEESITTLIKYIRIIYSNLEQIDIMSGDYRNITFLLHKVNSEEVYISSEENKCYYILDENGFRKALYI